MAARASDDLLSQRIDDLRDGVRTGFADVRTEMRAGFSDVRVDMRALRWRVDALLVAILGVVATLAVKL
jgi:hypothetical protein